MGNIFEKNLSAWDEQYKDMADWIRKADKENKECDIEVETDRNNNGNLVIRVKKDEKIKYITGKRNTTEMAENWVKSLGKVQRYSPICMIGMGNISFLRELIRKTDKTVKIVVYEPSLKIFLTIMKNIDITDIIRDRVIGFIIEGLNEQDKDAILSIILRDELLPNLKTLILPNYDVLFKEQSIDFFKRIVDTGSSRKVNRNTIAVFSKVMVNNLFHNMPYIIDGYKTSQLVDVIPRDIPAIIVAAGPSLNKNIHELRNAKNKALIIAVDTAIKPLLNNGIVPDMFVTVDGEKPIELVEIDGAQEIPLLASVVSAYEVLKFQKSKKFFFDEGYSVVREIFLRNNILFENLNMGGSVATVAFSLAYKIGITRIILVGQDLAFTDNKTHADGTFKEKMDIIDTSNYIMVEGNCEEKVPTREDLKIYLNWYNKYIEGCSKRSNLHVINATEGGAKIKNTEIMTLKEAVKRECKKEVDIKQCLDKLETVFNKGQQETAKDYFRHIPNELYNIKNEARGLCDLYSRLDMVCKNKANKEKELKKILKNIEKNTENIEKNNCFQIISMTLTNGEYIIKNEQYMYKENESDEIKEISRKGKIYAELIEECASLYKELAEQTLAKV